ncbi:transposase [Mycobacterium tuberculosis T92]|nr:transposase [Mycobacterium tuberculosis T92]
MGPSSINLSCLPACTRHRLGRKMPCDGCSITHQRDDNAAINSHATRNHLASSAPVGAAVKRGADRKTGPGPAGGREARKGTGHPAGEQPRDGVLVA